MVAVCADTCNNACCGNGYHLLGLLPAVLGGTFPASATIDGNRSTAVGAYQRRGTPDLQQRSIMSGYTLTAVTAVLHAGRLFTCQITKPRFWVRINPSMVELRAAVNGFAPRLPETRSNLPMQQGDTSRSAHIHISNQPEHVAGTSCLEDSMNSSVCQFRGVANSYLFLISLQSTDISNLTSPAASL